MKEPQMYTHLKITAVKAKTELDRDAVEFQLALVGAAPQLKAALEEITHMVEMNLNPAYAGDGKVIQRCRSAIAAATYVPPVREAEESTEGQTDEN